MSDANRFGRPPRKSIGPPAIESRDQDLGGRALSFKARLFQGRNYFVDSIWGSNNVDAIHVRNSAAIPAMLEVFHV